MALVDYENHQPHSSTITTNKDTYGCYRWVEHSCGSIGISGGALSPKSRREVLPRSMSRYPQRSNSRPQSVLLGEKTAPTQIGPVEWQTNGPKGNQKKRLLTQTRGLTHVFKGMHWWLHQFGGFVHHGLGKAGFWPHSKCRVAPTADLCK